MKKKDLIVPHILLLVTDQFRYDASISSVVTPNLVTLLQQSNGSTVFHRAYSSTPICTPARAALLTGKSPWSHGLLAYGQYTNCPKYPTTVPRILQQTRGYRTVAVGKNHYGPIKHLQGYQNETLYEGLADPDDYTTWFHQHFPHLDPKATCKLDWNDWMACPYYFEEYMHPTTWTTRTALEVLDDYFQDKGRENKDTVDVDPLFLKVSYHRPHSPYDPPRRILEQYLEGGSKANIPQLDWFVNDTSWDQMYKDINMTASAWAGNPGPALARHTRAGYLASVEFVDENIGKLLKAVHDKGLWEDFMIVWVTDHGDQNGDHYLWRKGYPWEASAHIPMVMKLPHSADQPPQNSYAVTELRDVAPTLYDLTGVLDSVQAQDPLMDGKSLLSILRGNPDSWVREWIDLELGTTYNATNHWNALTGYLLRHGKSTSITCTYWKYIFVAHDASERLFCLDDDPNETYDLAPLNEYHSTLVTWRSRLIDQFETEGRGSNWVVNKILQARPNSTLFGHNYPCKPHAAGHGRHVHTLSGGRNSSNVISSIQ